jgi:hypothetical protein
LGFERIAILGLIIGNLEINRNGVWLAGWLG